MPKELKFKFIVAADRVKESGCSQARLPGGRMVYYTRIGKDEPLKEGETVVAQADDFTHIIDRPEVKDFNKVMKMNRKAKKKGDEEAEDTKRLSRLITKSAALARGDYDPHEDPAP